MSRIDSSQQQLQHLLFPGGHLICARRTYAEGIVAVALNTQLADYFSGVTNTSASEEASLLL